MAVKEKVEVKEKVGYVDLILACESAWAKIQQLNPEVPDAVIVVGTGGRRSQTLYGHFLSNGWESEGKPIHEVLIVAEQLKRTPEEIFTTLLHESAHALANAREIKDCSGKWHNKKFISVAEELGLEGPESSSPQIGWSACTLPERTAEKYADVIEEMAGALKVCRKMDFGPKNKVKTTWVLKCDCDRAIRVGKKSIQDYADWDNVMIDCGLCGSEFKLTEDM